MQKKLIRILARALHEYVNFVHDPEKQYRSLSACWNKRCGSHVIRRTYYRECPRVGRPLRSRLMILGALRITAINVFSVFSFWQIWFSEVSWALAGPLVDTLYSTKGKLRWDGHWSIMHASGCPEAWCHTGFRHCYGFSVNRKYFVISCICAQKQYVDFRSFWRSASELRPLRIVDLIWSEIEWPSHLSSPLLG